MCKTLGHNKKNCPQINSTGTTDVQRVGSRPVSSNGNLRVLEPRDLLPSKEDGLEGDSIGSNMESDRSGDDENLNFEIPEEWEDVDVEDAPADEPHRIETPDFVPYGEPAYRQVYHYMARRRN